MLNKATNMPMFNVCSNYSFDYDDNDDDDADDLIKIGETTAMGTLNVLMKQLSRRTCK